MRAPRTGNAGALSFRVCAAGRTFSGGSAKPMRVDIYHHFEFDQPQLSRIETSLANLTDLVTKGLAMDATVQAALDTLTAKVVSLETVEGSAITLLQGLKSALDAALANADPAAVVAAVQSISDKLGTDTQTLADAVTANTPAAAAP